jgi:hypothetical protein
LKVFPAILGSNLMLGLGSEGGSVLATCVLFIFYFAESPIKDIVFYITEYVPGRRLMVALV